MTEIDKKIKEDEKNDEYTYDKLFELVNKDFKSGMGIDELQEKYNQSFSVIYEILGFKDKEDFFDE
tara:strand:+ start:1670 stop:1867 length:198 start_codon:yes stop_codon:yes gene_type:complete